MSMFLKLCWLEGGNIRTRKQDFIPTWLGHWLLPTWFCVDLSPHEYPFPPAPLVSAICMIELMPYEAGLLGNDKIFHLFEIGTCLQI